MLSTNEIGVPLIKASAYDVNHDGLSDRLDLQLQLKSLPGRQLPITQSIRNVRVIGTFGYILQDML